MARIVQGLIFGVGLRRPSKGSFYIMVYLESLLINVSNSLLSNKV